MFLVIPYDVAVDWNIVQESCAEYVPNGAECVIDEYLE
jgi:hypothetical protein